MITLYSTVEIKDYRLGELEGIIQFILQKKKLWIREKETP